MKAHDILFKQKHTEINMIHMNKFSLSRDPRSTRIQSFIGIINPVLIRVMRQVAFYYRLLYCFKKRGEFIDWR